MARLRVLRGVGLGAARTELDQLIIRQPRRPGQPVEVLGLVEVHPPPRRDGCALAAAR